MGFILAAAGMLALFLSTRGILLSLSSCGKPNQTTKPF